MPLSRFLNLMWHLHTMNMKPEEVKQLRRELGPRELLESGVPIWWDSDEEASASTLAAVRSLEGLGLAS